MNLFEIYTSGNSDIAVFNLLFVFYAIATIALVFGLLKFTKQKIAVNRFILGMLSVYIGSLVAFDITFGIFRKFGQQIPGPGAALLLMFIGMAFGGALMFVLAQKLIFKSKNIGKSTIGYVVAQPVLAILFFCGFNVQWYLLRIEIILKTPYPKRNGVFHLKQGSCRMPIKLKFLNTPITKMQCHTFLLKAPVLSVNGVNYKSADKYSFLPFFPFRD